MTREQSQIAVTVAVQLQPDPEELTTVCVLVCPCSVAVQSPPSNMSSSTIRKKLVIVGGACCCPPEHNDPRTNAATILPLPPPVRSPDPLLASSTGALTSYIATSRARCEHAQWPGIGHAGWGGSVDGGLGQRGTPTLMMWF